ncbi:uncharacterized protein SCHCODRAFT_02589988 [Schizophyllum commune H4-8]|nr:uncharacterized protein SCHCODRAFT_02589988 [Schizophyllum commune H4-8]KAI5888090.1 hypothetical protein SCHCODRAFT_02589988 [Schizophyllum commune H4-8]
MHWPATDYLPPDWRGPFVSGHALRAVAPVTPTKGLETGSEAEDFDVGHPTAVSDVRLPATTVGDSLQSTPLVDDGVRAKEEKEFARVKEQPPDVGLLFVKREAYAAVKNKISAQVRHDYRTPITRHEDDPAQMASAAWLLLIYPPV